MYLDIIQYKDICKLLNTANAICKEYEWLLNSYVSDFYLNKHWHSLPKCWREALHHIDSDTLANIIDCSAPLLNCKVALPLSLLSLRILVKNLQIVRRQYINHDVHDDSKLQHALIKGNSKMFWKHVKVKKRHEIEIMSEICYKMALQTKCYFIIDIGSGLGHLVRLLSYGYGLKVCGLEAQQTLTDQARKLDAEMDKAFLKHGYDKCENLPPSTHLNIKIKTASDGSDVITILEDTFGKDVEFGIVGLHPCGDLAVTLLQLFAKYPQVKFINVVGCCYMKLNTTLINFGYPISNFSKTCGYNLSYSALEVACHALEMYIQGITNNKCDNMKIHSYRAALEKLITRRYPDMHHSQVGSVKYVDGLTFSAYVTKAISKLNIEINNSEVDSNEIKKDLEEWHHLVTFYSLRLMLAPLVETIILLDRVLFIHECGYSCYITSAFDPKISPRNCVIGAIKD